MSTLARSSILLTTALIAVGLGVAGTLDGSYTAEGEPSLTLTLNEAPDGSISGTLGESGMVMPIQAFRRESGFAGTIGPSGEAFPFAARLQGDRLILEIGDPGDAERLTFVRSGGGRPGAAAAATPATASRHVTVNGRRYTDAELARIEQTYGIRIPDADYWYDPVLGAWGGKGGPTMGFIAPGLDLGAPLRADASGGGTSIFINGRELHILDVAALQQITGPIAPGRYFITADGLAGYEGGPAQWNLSALASPDQGGGSNTWQSRITGASGFSDGTTGAVFLPNGGIVSTGN